MQKLRFLFAMALLYMFRVTISPIIRSKMLYMATGELAHCKLTLILRRSRTGTVWFYTSTSNKRAGRPKQYTESLTRDLKLMYSRLTLVRISIKL